MSRATTPRIIATMAFGAPLLFAEDPIAIATIPRQHPTGQKRHANTRANTPTTIAPVASDVGALADVR
jgi:hypothetical protein